MLRADTRLAGNNLASRLVASTGLFSHTAFTPTSAQHPPMAGNNRSRMSVLSDVQIRVLTTAEGGEHGQRCRVLAGIVLALDEEIHMHTPNYQTHSTHSFRHSRLAVAMSSLTLAIALTACGPQNGAPVAAAPAPSNAQPVPAAVPAPAPAPVAMAAPAAQPAPVAAAPAPRAVAKEPARQVASANLGEVQSIEPIRTRPQGSGAGAVIGGVLGAVVGNQFGAGNGRAAMTGLGAIGGAVAGNNVERNRNEGIAGYRVSVRLDNGQSRTYEESSVDGLRVGDRVRVDGSRIRRV